MAQTTTSSTKLPGYVEEPIKTSLKSIEDFLGSDANYVYGSKPGESLYTPLSGGQQESIGNVNWLADQDMAKMFGISDAEGMWQDFADDGPARLDGGYDRIVDDGGRLGGVGDYMNPYLEGVLDPQVREINEQLQRSRNDLGGMTAMSGAFGDARHGILEGELYSGANEAIGDVTGQAYADAFDRAMGLRSGDLSRFHGIDLANQGAEEAATTRKAAGAQGITDLGSRYFNMFGDVNDMLFNAGEVEREAEEERRQTMQAFQEALSGKKYDDALKLLMAAQGAPMSTTSTSKTKSDDGLWGLLGSAVGALF